MADRNDTNRNIATDETIELIASDKVEGTAVYGTDGDKLGHIKNLMLGKRSGQVDYAVLVSGGLFGMGGDYYPLPWDVLTYDTDQGGYVVNIDRNRLEGGPHYAQGTEPRYDRAYGMQINDYYGVTRTVP
jgi:hypothetical protein